MRKTLFASLALTALLALPVAAQNFDTIPIRTVPLSKGLAMLMGAGGNLAVSYGDDATFLIDDQFAPMVPKIVAAIAALTPNPTKFLVNTHVHGDHTGGNEELGKAGVIIVAHDNVRARMTVEQFSKMFNRTTPAAPKVALPVVTFTDQVTFHVNGDDIQVMHMAPAHTDGDAIIWFKNANVVHMGDLYFKGRFPFVDVESGGSVEGVIDGCTRVLGFINDNTKVIPGHGDLSNKAELTEYRNVLITVRDRVKKLIAQKKTVEEAIAAKPLADLDATWGSGFIKSDVFLRLAYATYGKVQ